MTRHLHGDGETMLTGAVGKPKPSPGPIRFPFACSDGETRTAKSQRYVNGVRVITATDDTLWKPHATIGHTNVPYVGDVEDEADE